MYLQDTPLLLKEKGLGDEEDKKKRHPKASLLID
jgi:hypothetical protein